MGGHDRLNMRAGHNNKILIDDPLFKMWSIAVKLPYLSRYVLESSPKIQTQSVAAFVGLNKETTRYVLIVDGSKNRTNLSRKAL